MEGKTKVIVVDDQNIARGFFEMHIKTSIRYELVRSLPSADMAVSYIDQNPVDLVIMDVMMRYGMDGLSAAEKIKKNHPGTKIILVTSMAEASWEKRAKEAGIDSFWYKEYSEEPLIEIMDRTMQGESIYPGRAPSLRFGKVSRDELTERELDVLRELTSGATNEEIAHKLFISVNTVKRHIQNLMDKSGFKNRLSLAINATSLGLVVSEDGIQAKDSDFDV
ncbi:MAG: response regulator transcription factor [Firmicutes bacterium]|nr:response regulator transcription factor [Bacillota bacterium]